VATHQGSATATARDLMQRADEQLYLAKDAGRNCYKIESDAA
jgi:PleD family two-component response regulator